MREKKEINIQIGEQIKAAREQARLTQEQLAERIDVSAQYVSDLERGVVGLSILTLKKVCFSLGVSSDQILFGTRPENDFSLIADRCRTLSGAQFTLLAKIIESYIEAVNLGQTGDMGK